LIINEDDCGTQDGIWVRKTDNVAGQPMATRLFGRLLAEKIVDSKTGKSLEIAMTNLTMTESIEF